MKDKLITVYKIFELIDGGTLREPVDKCFDSYGYNSIKDALYDIEKLNGQSDKYIILQVTRIDWS